MGPVGVGLVLGVGAVLQAYAMITNEVTAAITDGTRSFITPPVDSDSVSPHCSIHRVPVLCKQHAKHFHGAVVGMSQQLELATRRQ